MQLKTATNFSLVFAVCALSVLIFLAYQSGVDLERVFTSVHGITILLGTLLGSFLACLSALRLLVGTTFRSKMVFVGVALVCSIAWYEYETMTISIFVSSILPSGNPYDGHYTYVLSNVKSESLRKSFIYGEKLGAQRLTLTIDGHDAYLFGYRWNAPALINPFRAYLEDGTITVRCGEEDRDCKAVAGGRIELVLTPLENGDLLCPDCERQGYPGYWNRISQ